MDLGGNEPQSLPFPLDWWGLDSNKQGLRGFTMGAPNHEVSLLKLLMLHHSVKPLSQVLVCFKVVLECFVYHVYGTVDSMRW